MTSSLAPQHRTRLLFPVVGLVALLSAGLALAEPQVYFTDIVSGPNTGGENGHGCYLSIFGKGFGPSKGSSRVFINGTEVADYKYWGPAQYANGCCGSTPGRLGLDQISIQPGSEVTSGAITVVVDGESSDGDHTFTVRPGDIYFVVPGSDPSKGAIGDISQPYVGIDDLYNGYDVHSDSGFDEGDFMVLRGGTYLPRGRWDHWVRIDEGAGGTADRPLTFYGYPGENVILDGTGDSNDSALFYNGNDDDPPQEGYVFANFKLKENNDAVLRFGDRPEEMNHVRMVNLDLHAGKDGKAGTVALRRADHLKMFGLYIHDNFVEPGHGSKFTHQVYFSDGSHDVEFAWSELARFDGGVTISIRRSIDGPPFTVHYNMSLHHLMVHDQTSGAIVFGRSTGPDLKFYNNLIYRTGKHLGIDDDNVNHLAGVQINDYWGVDGGSEPDIELDLFNNVIYDVGNENQPLGCFSFDDGAITMRNNVCVVLTPEPYGRLFDENGMDRDNITASNNVWWHPGGVGRWGNPWGDEPDPDPPSWLIGPTDVVADPEFVNPDALLADFHLKPDSPAIDTGFTANFVETDFDFLPRPMDGDGNGSSKFDIGPFEVQGESTAPWVSIDQPTTASSYATEASSITVAGTATDNEGVTSITWTSSSGAGGSLPGGTNWSLPNIALEVGNNVITVTAHDADENTGSDTITITRLVAPPPPGDVSVN